MAARTRSASIDNPTRAPVTRVPSLFRLRVRCRRLVYVSVRGVAVDLVALLDDSSTRHGPFLRRITESQSGHTPARSYPHLRATLSAHHEMRRIYP